MNGRNLSWNIPIKILGWCLDEMVVHSLVRGGDVIVGDSVIIWLVFSFSICCCLHDALLLIGRCLFMVCFDDFIRWITILTSSKFSYLWRLCDSVYRLPSLFILFGSLIRVHRLLYVLGGYMKYLFYIVSIAKNVFSYSLYNLVVLLVV